MLIQIPMATYRFRHLFAMHDEYGKDFVTYHLSCLSPVSICLLNHMATNQVCEHNVKTLHENLQLITA